MKSPKTVAITAAFLKEKGLTEREIAAELFNGDLRLTRDVLAVYEDGLVMEDLTNHIEERNDNGESQF